MNRSEIALIECLSSMDAPRLLLIFDVLYLLAMVGWVGSIAFFSFGVAPVIFQVLRPEAAAAFVRALFPRYYAWGATCGVLALSAYVCGVLTHPQDYRGPLAGVQATLLLSGTLVMLYCGNVLTPAINAARDAGPDQAERFDRLHRRSVRLNSLVLLLGVVSLVAFAARPAPKTSGILEPTPGKPLESSSPETSGCEPNSNPIRYEFDHEVFG